MSLSVVVSENLQTKDARKPVHAVMENPSARIRVVLTGNWPEGIGIITVMLEKSGKYDCDALTHEQARLAVKKRGAEAIVMCVQGDENELPRRLDDIRLINEGLPVFVVAKSAPIAMVVDLVRRGACDFLVKPIHTKSFLEKLGREIHLYNLTKKIFGRGYVFSAEWRFENMIGRSRKMQDNFQMIAAVAKSNATVLITGESGVGKELVASALHRLSERSAGKFVDINCGAIPRELLENELFGHEKGAFTGAHKRYVGSFETAHHGTLFLDEISEIDVHLQVKLLRVLQERSFARVGGTDHVNTDVRIIAATNRRLQEAIAGGEFREDLYYRLNVINIDVPALRERREDIPLLARHFLEFYSAKNNRIFVDFATDAMEALINYDWPGNVRELENTIERIVVLHDDTQVKARHLPPHLQKVDLAISHAEEPPPMREEPLLVALDELEKKAIEATLLKYHGNVALASKKLGIGQATLYRKVRQYKITV